MVHWVILCETADVSDTYLFTRKSPQAMESITTMLYGDGKVCSAINCTNRRDTSAQESFFRHPKDEGKQLISDGH